MGKGKPLEPRRRRARTVANAPKVKAKRITVAHAPGIVRRKRRTRPPGR